MSTIPECNLHHLSVNQIIKKLDREIRSFDLPPYTVRKPLLFFSHIPYLHDKFDFGEDRNLSDKLRLYKLVVIFDQFNIQPHPCRYCKLPFSLGKSWMHEGDVDRGKITYQEYKENPGYSCLFCEQLDYAGTDIYHAFSILDGNSREDRRNKEDIQRCGTDHAILIRLTDREYAEDRFIHNFHKIWSAESIEEVEQLLQEGIASD